MTDELDRHKKIGPVDKDTAVPDEAIVQRILDNMAAINKDWWCPVCGTRVARYAGGWVCANKHTIGGSTKLLQSDPLAAWRETENLAVFVCNRTGMGKMDCMKALVASKGDVEEAAKIIRMLGEQWTVG